MLKESAKHLFYVLFSWAIPFAFVGYAWCKSHVKALVYSNYDGKADIYFVCFCHRPFCKAEGPWSTRGWWSADMPKNKSCDWSMRISLVIFVVLPLVIIYWGQAGGQVLGYKRTLHLYSTITGPCKVCALVREAINNNKSPKVGTKVPTSADPPGHPPRLVVKKQGISSTCSETLDRTIK
jgi:hypothetical protein